MSSPYDQLLQQVGLERQPVAYLNVQMDGETHRVYVPYPKNEPNSSMAVVEDMDHVVRTVKAHQWVRESGLLDNLGERKKLIKLFRNSAVPALIGTLVFANIYCWFETEFHALTDEAKCKRWRRYEKSLVSYDFEEGSYVISIPETALDEWVRLFSVENEKYLEALLAQTLEFIYTRALIDVLDTPEKDRDYYEVVRRELKRQRGVTPTDEDFKSDPQVKASLTWYRTIEAAKAESVIKDSLMATTSIVNEAWDFVRNAPGFTLDAVEQRILRLVALEAEPGELPFSTGDATAGITEGVNAATKGGWWPDEDGVLSYQTKPLPDGLVIKLNLTEDGISPITVLETAQAKLKEIDPLAARLWDAIQTVAEQQANPWSDTFILDTEDLACLITMGEKGRKGKAEQAAAIAKRVKAISRIQVCFDWIDDHNEYTRTATDLLRVSVHKKWFEGDCPSTTEPYRIELEITPGDWVRQASAPENGRRDLLWSGYLSKDILKQRPSLAKGLHVWYIRIERIEFTVYDWLCGVKGRDYMEQLNRNKPLKSKLKKQFDGAIAELKNTLKPSFSLEGDTKDWLLTTVRKQVQPEGKTILVSELRELRAKYRLSQKRVGELLDYAQNTISLIERDPIRDREAAELLRTKLGT